jgi:putative ATPase
MRSGEVDEAIGWLGQYLYSGGDPIIIARRLVIFASEDVGNAAPFGLTLASSSFEAIKNVGMPEARINLAHIVTYLANAPKSRAAYDAINTSIEHSKSVGSIMIPNKRLNRKNKIDCDMPRFPKFYFPSGKGHDLK